MIGPGPIILFTRRRRILRLAFTRRRRVATTIWSLIRHGDGIRSHDEVFVGVAWGGGFLGCGEFGEVNLGSRKGSGSGEALPAAIRLLFCRFGACARVSVYAWLGQRSVNSLQLSSGRASGQDEGPAPQEENNLQQPVEVVRPGSRTGGWE
jgi:hypothetical protein